MDEEYELVRYILIISLDWRLFETKKTQLFV